MKLNCLIVGYGYMGKIRYQVLRRHPDVASVKVWDPYLKSVPNELGGDLLPSTDGAIPWKQFDTAFVCTPNNVTAEICVEALMNCKRVFCEKPPGRSFEEFSRIEQAALSVPDHLLMFGFNHRLHPSVQAARAMIGDGGLGKILYMKGTYGKSGGAKYRESWRNQKDISGGGILLDQGIHMLDIFQIFLGRLNLVDAVLADSFWHCGVEDNAFVLLRSEEQIPAFLHSSATLWKHTFKFEIGCEKGYLVASGFLSQSGSYGREMLVIGKRQFEDEALALGNPREEIIHFDRDDSWEKEVAEFLSAAIESRSATHGTLAEARHVMQLIKDVYVRRGSQIVDKVSL
jgi:1,5-anhydro-D-fructose reductase (1,5-anhydro-D-mannitol-forming)